MGANPRAISGAAMDPVIILSVVMLLVWAAGTWFEVGGWIHLLLTAGVFVLIWRIATRNARATGTAKR
jgi:hypothetical protein